MAAVTAVGRAHRAGAMGSVRVRSLVRVAIGAAILVAILVQAGAEPFLRGLAAVSVPAVAAAVAFTAMATGATAWRWRVIAGRLGLALSWPGSVTAYYRSQFLNTVLPAGVLGDVHRAVAHGHEVGQLGQASRAVVTERGAGQVVQLALTLVVLIALGAWAYAPAVGVVIAVALVACIGVLVACALSGRAAAAVRREAATLRRALGSPAAATKVAAASLIAIAAHVGTFIVACLAVGVDAPFWRLVALAVVTVLAGAIPLSVGGWGPREGIAAWAFATLGLGAATGIAASTAFGVLAMIALAPGAVVLAVSAFRSRGGDVVAARQESPSP